MDRWTDIVSSIVLVNLDLVYVVSLLNNFGSYFNLCVNLSQLLYNCLSFLAVLLIKCSQSV